MIMAPKVLHFSAFIDGIVIGTTMDSFFLTQ